ncbi:S41 family peptidase [Actomonas aquatica]|uniref:Tricorn protease homolog n=1 Tax=Actomonas aquatica TaxID=2866162 RepID=A0ABZ1C555_9BACT|nr:S41 family peptidase [Opitutus sp. WL0086]WRQ86864.1 PDZ domain-containing protein [Opitutus sp. WL0086]
MHTLLGRSRYYLTSLLAILLSASVFAAGESSSSSTRLLRFPTTNGEQIVFSYAGQLYTVDVAGGTARRLTNTPGYAVFPRFSADGAQLAFTGQYDGNTEVYVMPATGGEPQRLTTSATLGRDDLADRMGPNNIVMAWRNTAPEIAFRSRAIEYNSFNGQLYTVGLDGDVPERLPVPRGGFLTFSPDDSKIAYNRIFREFRTWKHYRGGMADDVWILDLKSGELENLTNDPAQDIFPMWASDNHVYFVSERTPRANLFSVDLTTKEIKQLTHFTDFDVKFPSLGPDAVVFENAGQIWRFDLATQTAAVVPITVIDDRTDTRPSYRSVENYVESVSPSPDGARVTVVARGEVFTVPAQHGPTRNLSNTPGVHERSATWSPDGKWVAYLSDATGEFELYLRAQDGSGEATQLTDDATSYAFGIDWSPDSKKLLWADRDQRLRMVDVESKTVTDLATNPESPIYSYTWAPDSNWVAWVRNVAAGSTRVMLTNVTDGTEIAATDEWFNANSPAFSDDGKWLLFASARDFNPIYSDVEWNYAYMDMERVYMVALAKDTESPFAPRSDEVKIAEDKPADDAKSDADEKSDDEKKADDEDAEPAITVKVDTDGLYDRVIALPIEPSNYRSLYLVDGNVYYYREPGSAVTGGHGGEGFGGDSGRQPVIVRYSLEDREETVLGAYNGFEITADHKKMLVVAGHGSFSLIDLPAKGKIELKPENKISLSGLKMVVDPRAEWAQIFDESWRQMRDFFYDANMHGVDWQAMHDKYGALVPSVATRNDLTYLIGEMIGELHIGHAYVGGGDRNNAPRIQTGLLGAQVSRDEASRAYRIDHILPGANWHSNTRSPLTELGVNVSEGDYILAIDGRPVAEMNNLFEALIGKVGAQVKLTVNGTPTTEGARDVTIVPIGDEADLYYEQWVENNIDYVTERTDGRVGYLHIPDMGPPGLNAFVRRFYPQLNKDALIIDVRGNGGGNVSPMIIERLSREIAMIELRRGGTPRADPGGAIYGPKVMLMDEFSASDGDIVNHRFRAAGLGKLIGKRSWGGVVGIWGSLPFIDGGSLHKPESGPYALDGSKWVIEGHGVDPDIVVDNDPWKEFHGEDQQLDRGIEEVLAELEQVETGLPPPPPHPDKSL